MFSTHPSTDNRVAALEALADEWALNEDAYVEETEDQAMPEIPPQAPPPKPKKAPAKTKKPTKSSKHDWGRGSDAKDGKKSGGIWN